jgi:D-beta-D-heptose 7-phosphate kinase/D-beta-D-heptose 1-phosphate adenosyltransferase
MITASEHLEVLQKFEGTPVLCIGDLMLDRYVHGRVTRISPEAPIPILRIDRETAMPGAVGNVAGNIQRRSGTPAAAFAG